MDEEGSPSSSELYLPDSNSGLSRGSVLTSFLRTNFLIIALGLLGLIFLSLGIITLVSKKEDSDIVFEQSSGAVKNKLKVDIEGAVVKPGVYEIGEGGRIQEALILAGGLSSIADRDWVAKNLNLASKLADGAKIYIPQKDEVRLRPAEQGYGGQGGIKNSGELKEKININSAPLEDLDKLPGIGSVTAQKIIEGRPYQTVDDLVAKKIVGTSAFSKIKDQITVW